MSNIIFKIITKLGFKTTFTEYFFKINLITVLIKNSFRIILETVFSEYNF